MPRRGRPSTDITSRTVTPEYCKGHAQTFGAQQDHLGKRFSHTQLVIRTDPVTGKQTLERTTDA